jgi:hypothetical protein
MGFGIEQDRTSYFAILKECCEIEYKPAQQSLPQVHAAIGLPLAEYTESRPAMQDSSGTGDKNEVINMTLPQINQRNSDGDLPLIAACRAGNLDVACLLIEKGADCALRNKLGETAIHWVWTFDDASLPRIIAQLTHSGADPNAVAKENFLYTDDFQFPLVHGTALLRAVSQGNKKAVRELILNGASVSDTSGPMIFHKQRHWNLDAVQLACGDSVGRFTVLSNQCGHGHWPWVIILRNSMPEHASQDGQIRVQSWLPTTENNPITPLPRSNQYRGQGWDDSASTSRSQ